MSEIESDGGVGLVEIRILDEDGKPVILAEDEITCTLSGPVKLLGLEASNPTDMGDYSDNRQRVFQGKMMAYIKATGKKGQAKVRFESPWLKSAEVDLMVE